ncbi:mechanosensitive ion channel family protein [Algicella marina]|uniref:Mechanosensitive ion channel n=1 Tax=Algicella marina TaxID=2683284 RepID=A0A6P1T6Y9_9RHOB|nr:mechanosensitive ion channel family protein [Algicella marina]QHQ37049.1 mechanosensitive ion channel [Algicella marina]
MEPDNSLVDFFVRLRDEIARLPDFVLPLAGILAAIVTAIALHALIYRIVFARIETRFGLTTSLLNKARRPARLAFVLVALILTVPLVQLPNDWQGGIRHAASVMLITLIGWTLIVLVNYFAERSTRRYRMDIDDNLMARKHITQMRVLRRTAVIIIGMVTAGIVLLTFEGVQKYGVSLFASAGAAGLVVGFAARPVLANLIAGVQIAITQPIRLGDVVIVEDEWGWIEEIYSTFVVVRIWDWRRMVVPLSYFIEQPFQNWTRESAAIIGTVTWELDHTAPIAEMRAKLTELLEDHKHWDRDVANLQVTESQTHTITVRALMSARTSPRAWDLRCDIREAMLTWLKDEHPHALPRIRGEMNMQAEVASKGTLKNGSDTRPSELAEPG